MSDIRFAGFCSFFFILVGAVYFWVSSFSCMSTSGIPIADNAFEIGRRCALSQIPREFWGSIGHACPTTQNDKLMLFDDVQLLLVVLSDKCSLQDELLAAGFLPVYNSNVTLVCQDDISTRMESLSLMQTDSPEDALKLVRRLCDRDCGILMWSMKGSDACSAVRLDIICAGGFCFACVALSFLYFLDRKPFAIYMMQHCCLCFREREDTMTAETQRQRVDTSRSAYVSDGVMATRDTYDSNLLAHQSVARVVATQLAQHNMCIELNSPIEFVEPVFCVICLTQEFACSMIKLTQCGHAFHLGCIIQWSSAAGTCPLCRSMAKTGQLLVVRAAEHHLALHATDGFVIQLQDNPAMGEPSDSDDLLIGSRTISA